MNVSHGEVLLSRGAGYESIKGSADVATGDTVFGKPGSAAQIVFADGCAVFLGVGIVFRVGGESPCGGRSGAAGASETKSGGWGAATETLPGGDWNAGTETTLAADGQSLNVWPYVLGAAALGGVAALAQSSGGSGGGGPPASP